MSERRGLIVVAVISFFGARGLESYRDEHSMNLERGEQWGSRK